MVMLALALLTSAGAAAPAATVAPVVARVPAQEARQGVVSDGTYVYAIDNNRIGKYRIADGVRVSGWEGDKATFPHINSCNIVGRELICAASNYPAVPQTSAVEIFDLRTLRHLRTVSLGIGAGSLTVLDRHRSSNWAIFAHYDARGGEPGKDHRYTQLVRMDDSYRVLEGWTFPPEALARFAPASASGGSWGSDGRFYVSGHDHPEIYVLEMPKAGSVLRLVATIAVATEGQAIDWDPRVAGRLWSINRKTRELVASDLSALIPAR